MGMGEGRMAFLTATNDVMQMMQEPEAEGEGKGEKGEKHYVTIFMVGRVSGEG